MRSILIILVVFLSINSGQTLIGQGSADLKIQPLTIGETVQLSSEVLNEERLLHVYLPPGYSSDPTAQFPVIYVLDGSLDQDFIHIAGLVQFCSFSWIDLVPESIVVGIANVDRRRDFTYPSSNELDQRDFPTAGGSASFMEFLRSEAMPAIEKQYRTSGESTLIGQSLGGLLATEMLFKYPDSFDRYVIVSPSLWWDSGSLMDLAMTEHSEPLEVFVTVGKEDREMEGGVMALVARLLDWRSTETDGSKVVHYTILPEYNHGDILHAAVYEAFKRFKEKEQ